MAKDKETLDLELRLRNAKKVQKDLWQTSRQVSVFGKQVKISSSQMRFANAMNNRFNAGLRAVGRTLRTGVLVGMGGLAALAVDSVKGWQDHLEVMKRTRAVIKSTGGAANITAAQVETLSDGIESYTGMDGDLVQGGANMLLTFTKIRNGVGKTNKVFDEATKTAVGMAQALGSDPRQAAVMLGKALNDPIRGVTALRKVGASFTDEQMEQIKALVESGKMMRAQKLILRELNNEFPRVKGNAFQLLMVQVNRLKDTIGEALLPYVTKGTAALTKFLKQMQTGRGAGGAFVKTLKDIASFVKTQVFPAIAGIANRLITFYKDLREGKPYAVGLAAALGTLATALGALIVVVKIVNAYQKLKVMFMTLKVLVPALSKGFTLLKTAVTLLATGFRILALAIISNPIGAIIAGVIALGVAFVVAYKKIGWFRNIVNAVFAWIKNNWPLILSILTGPIGAAVFYIIRHWEQVKAAAGSVVGFVKDRFNDLVGFFSGMPGRIASAASGMWQGVKDGFKDAINWIISGWNNLSLTIGGVKIDPPGPGSITIPSVTLSTPDIPLLAEGGLVRGRGSWITGEAGPELNTLTGSGVRVQPLSGAAVGAAGMGTIEVPVFLDGREIARQIARVADAKWSHR